MLMEERITGEVFVLFNRSKEVFFFSCSEYLWKCYMEGALCVKIYGENRHIKMWIAQLWKPMDRAYANVAAPQKILTDWTFLKLHANWSSNIKLIG